MILNRERCCRSEPVPSLTFLSAGLAAEADVRIGRVYGNGQRTKRLVVLYSNTRIEHYQEVSFELSTEHLFDETGKPSVIASRLGDRLLNISSGP